MQQKHYLVGYDISDPKRQAVVRYHVKSHTSSGQKSAYECPLTPSSKHQLSEFALSKIETSDSFFILRTLRTYWSQVADHNQLPPNAAVTDHFYLG
jgi:CRISPR-associated endonuclease Cas2